MKKIFLLAIVLLPDIIQAQNEIINPAALPTGAGVFWKTLGNANTVDGTHFIGTTDMKPLNFRIGNVMAGRIDSTWGNVFWGFRAGSNTSGRGNVAIGHYAFFYNNTGSNNTALGYLSLFSNTTGEYNTALGNRSLFFNSSGSRNIAIGDYALYNNTDRSGLVAIGDSALFNNGVGVTFSYQGTRNTAIGSKTLFTNTTGYENTALGSSALVYNVAGWGNTAVGNDALHDNNNGSANTAVGNSALYTNTISTGNTAIGAGCLYSNTFGAGNTAVGLSALSQNTNGGANSALGAFALTNNTTGQWNTAVGVSSLSLNSIGNYNTAMGYFASRTNTIGEHNTSFGAFAASHNSLGQSNVAVGYGASYNSEGNYNTVIGAEALYNSSFCNRNVAVGYHALYDLAFDNAGTGYNGYNTAIGYAALEQCNPTDGTGTGTGKRNTALGGLALNTITTGKMNTGIGFNCDVPATFENCTVLGYNSVAAASNNVRVGNTAVVGIFGAVNFNTSDERFKTDVANNVPGLSFINNLRPVTYQFQKEKYSRFVGEEQEDDYVQMLRAQDQSGKRSSGFIAQEVEALADSLGYDFDGLYKPQNAQDAYALGYAQFVVPLVKAVQEQQQQLHSLALQVENLQIENLQLRKTLQERKQ